MIGRRPTRVLFATLIFASFAPAVRGDSFSWELAGARAQSEPQRHMDLERDALLATYYFKAVDDSTGPYALASFLDPASRVSLGLSRETHTSSPPASLTSANLVPADAVTSSIDEYSLGGRYVLPRSQWYFGGNYTDAIDFGGRSLLRDSMQLEQYEVLVGRYLGEATAIGVGVVSERHRIDFPSPTVSVCIDGILCQSAEPIRMRSKVETTTLSVRHVLRGHSLTYALSGSIARTSGHAVTRFPEMALSAPPATAPSTTVRPAHTTETDLGGIDVYSVGAELFPTQKLGVRLGLSRWDGDTPENGAYDLGVTWFMTPKMGLSFSYSRQRNRGEALPPRDETAALRFVGRL